MPYLYRGPNSSSPTTGGPLGFGSSSYARRYNTGASWQSFLGQGPSPLSQQGSRAPERGAPERFDMQLMEHATRLATSPAAIAERPLALLDQVGRFVTGTKEGDPGPVHQVLEAASHLPVIPGLVDLGDAVDFGGEVLERVGNFIPALTNSGDAQLLAAVVGKPDTMSLTDAVGNDNPLLYQMASSKQKNGLPIFNWFGENMTVGDLKAELQRRGFNNETLEDGTVVEVPWERVAARVAQDPLGAFQFGDKLVNDSVLTDMAFRLTADPLNLLMGAGMVTKIGRAGALAANWARRLPTAGLTGRAIKPVEYGHGFVSDMAQAGVRATSRSAPAVGASEIAAGNLSTTTLQGFGTFLGRVAKGAFVPGEGSLARRYYRGALRMQLGGIGAEFGSMALRESSKNLLGEDHIVTGWMNGLHDFFNDTMNNRPLSENAVFVMAAAFHNPALPLLGEQYSGLKRGIANAAGDDGLKLFSDRIDLTAPREPAPTRRGRAVAAVREAADPLSDMRASRSRQDALLERFGKGDKEAGRIELARLWDHIDLQIAFDRIHGNIKRHFESFDDFVFRGESLQPMLREMVAELRARGELNPRLRWEKFEQWAKDTYRIEGFDEAGRAIRRKNEVEFDPSPEAMVDQWLQYSDALKAVAPQMEELGKVILGRAKVLSQESIDSLIAAVRAMSVDGKTPRSVVEAMLLRAPALLDDPRVNGDFWAKQGITAAGNGEYIGGRPSQAFGKRRRGDEGFDTEELVTELERIREIAPPEAELFHEARRLEADTPGTPDLEIDGPLVQGGLRKIHSTETLRRVRARSAGNIRALSKRERALVNAFNRRWTKNGRPRGTGRKPTAAIALSTVRRRADDIVEYTRANGGATFNPITGTFHERGGYGVGVVSETFRKVDPSDATALRAAMEDVVREYPDKHVGTWLDDDGVLHVDPSEVVADLDDAIRLAAERSQEAIWDFSAASEISNTSFAEMASPGMVLKVNMPTLLEQAFNLSRQEADDVAAVIDARARAWASMAPGRRPQDWYSQHIAAVTSGRQLASDFGSLKQTIRDVSSALERLDRAPSVPRGFEPTWESEVGGLKYRGAPESAEPGSTHVSRYEIPGAGPALSVVAYGNDGSPVGMLSVLERGTREAPQRAQAGAFKIVVDPSVQRQGIGLRLLDVASENGFDVAANVSNNAFTSSGRALVRRWLEQRQTGTLHQTAYDRAILREQRDAMHAANQARTNYADMQAAQGGDRLPIDRLPDEVVARNVAALDQILFGGQKDRGAGVGIRELIDQPEPEIFAEAGLGGSSAIEWVDVDGNTVGIPGGVEGLADGTFTLWDLWRLKAQSIDPNKLPANIRVPLYAKLFRSQVSGHGDPIDVFNRVTFAVLSPRNSLIRNEALQALLRVSDEEGIARLAAIADDNLTPTQIGQRLKEEFDLGAAGSGLTNAQLSAVAVNARRFLENPEWFKLRAGEDVLHYAERVSAVMSGSQMKVGTFGIMLGDPVGFSRGTIDSHMVRRLVDEGHVNAEDVAALKTADGYRNADGQTIMYRRADGTINPAVPEHLRDLPWDPPGNKITTYGKTYELLNEALRRKMREEGITDFDLGGFQWMEWDMQRKRLEPHTLAFPGAHKLPPIEAQQLRSALQTATKAGYFGKYREPDFAMQPMNPREAVFYKGDGGGTIQGEAAFMKDGRALVRGFEAADVSTALHEFAHVWRRDLDDLTLQRIEGHFKVKDRRWTEAKEEEFANTLVRYFKEGIAPTPELAGAFERFKSWLVEIYRYIKDAGRVRKIGPELRQELDALFQERPSLQAKADELRNLADDELAARAQDHSTPYEDRAAASIEMSRRQSEANQQAEWTEQRRAEMAEIAEVRAQMKAESEFIREIDLRAEEIRTVKPDPSLRNGKIPPDQQQLLKETISRIREEYPQYDLEASPLLSARVELDDGLLAGMFRERSMIAGLLFDYGPLGRVNALMHWLTDPVKSSKLARDARQMVFNKAVPLGVEPHTVQKILADLRTRATELTVGPTQVPLLRGITALPANTINKIARDVITLNGDGTINEAGMRAWKRIEQKYGQNGFHKLLDESANSFIRRVDTKRMKGQKVGLLEDSLREGYRMWQHAPVVGSTSRLASKTIYHLFRFVADVRWHALNLIEADMIALFRDGVGATRFGRRPGPRSRDALGYHAGKTDLSLPSVLNALDDVDVPAGAARSAAEAFADDSALYIFNRNLTPVLERAFERRRLNSVDDVLNALPENHPVIRTLVQKHGPSRKGWAKEIDDMLYSFDRRGVSETISEAVRRVRDEDGWSQMEYDAMVPFLQKLTDVNQGTFDDLIRLYQGNPDRGRLERIANSFWLYWPITYQIKATKWLLDVTLNRAFGEQTNFGGIWTLDRAAEAFKQRLAENPQFAEEMDKNEDAWFMASMLFPISPSDIGVSLNKGVRYVGSWLGIFPEYAGVEDPGDLGRKMLEMGPIYTGKLLQRVFEMADGGSSQSTRPTAPPSLQQLLDNTRAR